MSKYILFFAVLYLVLINLISFVQMGTDKRRAIHHERRISEKSLFTSVLLFGGIGGTFGMYIFHHKTKHWYFKLGFPLITIAEYIFLGYIIIKLNII